MFDKKSLNLVILMTMCSCTPLNDQPLSLFLYNYLQQQTRLEGNVMLPTYVFYQNNEETLLMNVL